MTISGRVILVHGLWYGRAAMKPLAARLRHAGWDAHLFGFRSRAAGLQTHAAALARFRAAVPGRVSFVGHSLGGLVVLRMLADGVPETDPGRVVLLGSPLQGSRVARRAISLAPVLLGKVGPDLCAGFGTLPAGLEVGMIAGSRPLGMGRLLGAMDEPGDGTVAVRETTVTGLRDHCVLGVSHTGLLLSRDVAGLAAHFLESGRFAHGARG